MRNGFNRLSSSFLRQFRGLEVSKPLKGLLAASAMTIAAVVPAKAIYMSQVNVYGVKLKMSADEAMAALKKSLGGSLQFSIHRNVQLRANRQMVDRITTHHGDFEIEVDFVDSPSPTQAEAAVAVFWRSKKFYFGGNREMEQRIQAEMPFIAAVISQHGQPDATQVCAMEECEAHHPGHPQWCQRPDKMSLDPCEHQVRMVERVTPHPVGGDDTRFELMLLDPYAEDAVYDRP